MFFNEADLRGDQRDILLIRIGNPVWWIGTLRANAGLDADAEARCLRRQNRLLKIPDK